MKSMNCLVLSSLLMATLSGANALAANWSGTFCSTQPGVQVKAERKGQEISLSFTKPAENATQKMDAVIQEEGALESSAIENDRKLTKHYGIQSEPVSGRAYRLKAKADGTAFDTFDAVVYELADHSKALVLETTFGNVFFSGTSCK